MIDIDNVTLWHYIERLSDDQKDQLRASANSGSQWGHLYVGRSIDIRLPMTLTEKGVPQLTANHFVAGGFLTPTGLRVAQLLDETEDDDCRL